LGHRIRQHPWIVAMLLGAATGFVFLGVGSRIAMRLFALHNGQPPGLSVGGTVTIIFMGVVSGIGGAAIRAAAATWLPRRAPDVVGTSIFAVACFLLTLRGLNPVDVTKLAYFLPLTVAYAVAFELLWRRRRPVASDAPPLAQPAARA
jgi:hypothetical protein